MKMPENPGANMTDIEHAEIARAAAHMLRELGYPALADLLFAGADRFRTIAADRAFRPTHRHTARGTEYQLVSRNGRLEASWEPAAIYVSEKAEYVACALGQPDDGRFEEITATSP